MSMGTSYALLSTEHKEYEKVAMHNLPNKKRDREKRARKKNKKDPYGMNPITKHTEKDRTNASKTNKKHLFQACLLVNK